MKNFTKNMSYNEYWRNPRTLYYKASQKKKELVEPDKIDYSSLRAIIVEEGFASHHYDYGEHILVYVIMLSPKLSIEFFHSVETNQFGKWLTEWEDDTDDDELYSRHGILELHPYEEKEIWNMLRKADFSKRTSRPARSTWDFRRHICFIDNYGQYDYIKFHNGYEEHHMADDICDSDLLVQILNKIVKRANFQMPVEEYYIDPGYNVPKKERRSFIRWIKDIRKNHKLIQEMLESGDLIYN